MSAQGWHQFTIIGVDCATDPRSIGLVRATTQERRFVLRNAEKGRRDMAKHVAGWIVESERTLIALDAPLGWPTALAEALPQHMAGEPIDRDPEELFSRLTDREVERHTKQHPLEVGANLIARTARAALAFLADLRRESDLRIPLAWHRGFSERAAAIEVYPAATLRGRGWPHAGYKRAANRELRQQITTRLEAHLDLGQHREALLASADVLDAAVCVLAATYFLEGVSVAPDAVQMDVARKEGWIWVKAQAAPHAQQKR